MLGDVDLWALGRARYVEWLWDIKNKLNSINS